jgi:hypothetical protein
MFVKRVRGTPGLSIWLAGAGRSFEPRGLAGAETEIPYRAKMGRCTLAATKEAT